MCIAVAMAVSPATVLAQTTLQSSGNGLQQQPGSTQKTQSLQNQTGNLQNSNGGSVLNKNQPSSLGVVSDPDQQKPDVTVPATSTTNKPGEDKAKSKLVLWVLAIAALALITLRIRKQVLKPRRRSYTSVSSSSVSDKAPYTQAVLKAAEKRKDKTKKKKPKKKRTHR